MDVVYETGPRGVKESVVLADRGVGSTFRFPTVLSPGLSLRPTAGGGVDVVDASGGRRFGFDPPFMVDAAGARSEAVSLTVSGRVLELSADPGWLDAPGRVWPVTIDPTLWAYGDSEECELSEGAPSVSSCSSATTRVGYDGNGDELRTLLGFDLADRFDEPVDVSQARLYLHRDPSIRTRRRARSRPGR